MWETAWDALIIAFALTVAVGDVRWRKIPRVLTTTAVAVGLIFHLAHGGFLSALVASLIGFGLGLSFFQLGAIGGGDRNHCRRHHRDRSSRPARRTEADIAQRRRTGPLARG